MVPEAPPAWKNSRATSCPAPISAKVPYFGPSKLTVSAFCVVVRSSLCWFMFRSSASLILRLRREQQLQRPMINAMQPIDVRDPHALVHFVNALVDDAKLDHLSAHGRDKSSVRGAAAG